MHPSSCGRLVVALSTLGLVLWPRPSGACGVCIAAAVDRVLPLSHFWSLLAVGWFVATAVAARLTAHKLPGIPSPGGAVLVVVGLGLVGIMALGPLGVLALYVPSLTALLSVWTAKRRAAARLCTQIGTLGLVAALGLGGYGYLFYRRTPAVYILQWESTYPARAALAALQQDGPSALPVYRQLVLAGNASTTGQAATRLGELGVPATDIPLLLRVRQRLRGSQGATDAVQQVEAALRRLEEPLGEGGE